MTQTLTFEGGTPGTLTTTNPPTSLGDTKFGVVTNTGTASGSVINTDAMHGSQCMECVQTSTTSSSEFGTWSGFTATSAACRFYFKMVALSSGDIVIMRSFNNSSARWLSVAITSANKLALRLTSSDTQVYLSTSAISANTWYRVEWSVTMGKSSNAVVNFQYYVGDSNTPVDSGLAVTNQNTGTGTQMADFRFGILSSLFVITGLRFDDLAVNPGTTTFIGPALVAPTASFTTSIVGTDLSVDGTASTAQSPATISSYDWNWGDATAHGSGSTASHTYAAAGTYTVTLTVTDSNSTTGSTTHSAVITAPPTATTYTSIATSNGTLVGGGSALAVITDVDGGGAPVLTTFLSSVDNPSASVLCEGQLGPLTAPQSGSPLLVTVWIDRINSSSGTITAELREGSAGGTLRSTLTGLTVPDMTASGGSGTVLSGTVSTTAVVELSFPWTDVQNVVDWNKLHLKITGTAT